MTDSDDYVVAAEYYDVWAHSTWNDLGPALREAVAGIDAEAGAVVDLGAGSGRATMTIADAVPDVRIVAVEPSRAMRGILTSRVVSRPDLTRRVTVVPTDLAGFSWPERVGGFVAMAMIGHLDIDGRRRLWLELAGRLAPGAPAIVQLLPPSTPVTIEPVRHTSVRMGDYDYEGWSEGEPAGGQAMRWTMTYRVLHDGELLDEQRWSSTYSTVSGEDVEAEVKGTGLGVTGTDSHGLLTLHRDQRA